MLNENLLNYQQAAELLNLKPGTLRLYVMRKEIPHIKINKSVRFSRESLSDWTASKLVSVQ